MILIKLFAILFVCVTVTDRFHFWDNLGSELHRLLMGKKKQVQLPYVLTCSLCQTFWLSLAYIVVFGHFTLLNMALAVLVCSCNQLMLQTLNLAENFIIFLIKKINDLL